MRRSTRLLHITRAPGPAAPGARGAHRAVGRALRAAALLVLAAVPAAAQDGPCRQALALGLDVSGSVDGAEYRLQLDGLAAALSHPDVTDALLATAGAPVSLAVYEWSGPTSQALIVDWTAITDVVALAGVTERLRANTRTPADPSTALGTAILVGGQLLAQRPDCWKRTLDISGDGESNTGRRPQDLDDAPELAGITVNALVIAPDTIAPPAGAQGLLGYFETYVIRGPGAFAEHAEDFDAYEAAMVRKLLKELQGMVVGAASPGPGAAMNGPETAMRGRETAGPTPGLAVR
ncbi:MAG: DUF1194 domain-containing protein [Maritimibacter sp.]|nr:DUF1194 domain-containing protein [Maritimibacter sp.]